MAFMIHVDMFTSFAIGGTASLLGLGVMSRVQTDQPKLSYALGLYRWAFLCIATLLAVLLAPVDRMQGVIQAVIGFVGMGVVLLGWAFRQLNGRRTPPWLGWLVTIMTGVLLWGAALALPDRIYVLALGAIFALISVVTLADQAWLILRGAQVSRSERVLLLVAASFAINWGILLTYAMTQPGPYPTHWIHGPSWWMAICGIGFALLPLAVASIVFAIINERLTQQLRTRALSDELTGALSRRGLRELGERLLVVQQQRPTQVAILMLDVDHFKKVNDTYGHLVGDDVLRHLVSVVRDKLRDDALLARYGGEEFTVLLPIRQAHEAKIVAERLRHAVESSPAQTTAGLVKVTISVGGAYHQADNTLEQTLAVADARLYEAKQTGRNKVVMDMQGAQSPAPEAPAEVVATT